MADEKDETKPAAPVEQATLRTAKMGREQIDELLAQKRRRAQAAEEAEAEDEETDD